MEEFGSSPAKICCFANSEGRGRRQELLDEDNNLNLKHILDEEFIRKFFFQCVLSKNHSGLLQSNLTIKT